MGISQVATVTSRSMVNIPAKIRRRYGIKEGTRVLFVETESGVKLIPLPPISELFGLDKEKKEVLLEAIRELQHEHRREASE